MIGFRLVDGKVLLTVLLALFRKKLVARLKKDLVGVEKAE